MRYSKVVTSRLAAGAALLAACVACGSCGLGDSRPVLRVANWGGAGDDSELARTMAAVYKEFEDKHGVRIQIEGVPGSQEYVNKMLLSFVARAEPDVMWLDASSAAVFINNGVLLDLAPLMAEDKSFDPQAFFPNVMGIAQRESKTFAVPLDFTPMVMYCNARLFREAGVDLPQPGWSWDDFRSKAKALTGKDRYGFVFSNWMPGWIMWLWNNGGDVIAPEPSPIASSPQNAETLSFLGDLIEKDKVAPSLSQMASLGVDPFAKGQAAMMISGHWSLVGLASSEEVKLSDLHIVPLPAKAGGPSQTVMYQSGLAVGKNSRLQKTAWEFVKHMTSREVQTRIQSTGLAVPARIDVARERAKNSLTSQFMPIIPSARAPWGSRVEGYDYVEQEGGKMMDNILKAGIEPEAALRELDAKLLRHFSEAK